MDPLTKISWDDRQLEISSAVCVDGYTNQAPGVGRTHKSLIIEQSSEFFN